ncbi:MAG: MATE family efflux transporter [Solobacterium sp.]|nr:MATE family efflux transporter [Solobacterium sp.]
MSEKKSMDYLGEAPVFRSYLKMSLPVVAGMLISLIYNLVDIYFISLTGKTELIAGVSLCTPIFTMLIALGDIFGLGGSSAVSRLLGAQKKEHAREVSVLSAWAGLLCGLAVGVLLLLFKRPALQLLGSDESTFASASSYLGWICAAAPFVVFCFVPINILRSEGKVRESFTGGAIGSVCNMILDPLLIFGLNLGAAGAALATFLAYLTEALYFAWVMNSKTEVVVLHPSYLHYRGSDLLEIFRIGIPACVTNLVQSLAVMLTNRQLTAYGNESIAGYGIASRAFMIATMVLMGFAFGGQPIIGYSYGSGNKKRLREIIRCEYIFEICLALLFTAVLILLAPLLMRIMTSSQPVYEIAVRMLRYMASSLIFMVICLVSTCIFQSVGQAGGAFAVSICRQGIIFAILLPLLSSAFGLTGILLAQPAADVLTALLSLIIFHAVMNREPEDHFS